MLVVFDAYLFMLRESLAIMELFISFYYIACKCMGDCKSFSRANLTQNKEV